jgi:hypothetical protein
MVETGGTLDNLTRRDFFTSCSKDMVKDALRTWQTFSKEMKKEETKLSCEEAAFKYLNKRSGKNFLNMKKMLVNRKEGK